MQKVPAAIEQVQHGEILFRPVVAQGGVNGDDAFFLHYLGRTSDNFSDGYGGAAPAAGLALG